MLIGFMDDALDKAKDLAGGKFRGQIQSGAETAKEQLSDLGN